MSAGKVVQVIGAVVDVEFPRESIPKVYDALKLEDRRADAGSAAAAGRRRRSDDCDGFQ